MSATGLRGGPAGRPLLLSLDFIDHLVNRARTYLTHVDGGQLARQYAADLKADESYQLLLKQQVEDARNGKLPPTDSNVADFAKRHGITP